MTTTDQIAERSGSPAGASSASACARGCGCTSGEPAGGSRTSRADDQPAADEVPIACTLSAAGMEQQLEAWHDLLAGVDDSEPLEDGLRLTFQPDTAAADVARLASAEQGCCAFFRFALTIDARGLALEVRAPHDAQDVLTALFGAAA